MGINLARKNDFLTAIQSYELWTFLAWHDIKIRYRRSKIGPLWITITTGIFCVTLGLVYSQLFKSNISDLLPHLTIGLVIWGFISSCIGEMPNLFVDNAPYIKDMRINPMSIVFRSIVRNMIILGHNLIIIFAIYLFYGIWPGRIIFLVIPSFVLVVLNVIAAGVVLSVIGARFRDLSQITQSILQIVFFITPIFWTPKLLEKGIWIVSINPAACFIDLLRSPLLGQIPELTSWMVSLLTLAVSSAIALLIYQKKSPRIVFWI